MNKLITIIVTLTIATYIWGVLILASVTSNIFFKPLDSLIANSTYITEDYLTAPFDNPGQFDTGWQGEENPIQLQ